jgi:hypothetical protein
MFENAIDDEIIIIDYQDACCGDENCRCSQKDEIIPWYMQEKAWRI